MVARGRATRGRRGQRGQRIHCNIPNNRPDVGGNEQSSDGTVWIRVAPGNPPCRLSQQNVFRETAGPTGYAKRHIVKDFPASAWRLFTSELILRLIKVYTELKSRKVLNNASWTVSLAELEAFIAILYARGAYGARTFKLHDLWNKEWGPPFFSQTMARNRLSEILRFLRFDEKETRAQRKQSDKFCLHLNCGTNLLKTALLVTDQQKT